MQITTYKTGINKEMRNVLIKDRTIDYDSDTLQSPKLIVSMMCDVFSLHTMAEEYVYLICLDCKCRPCGVFEVSHGSVNTSIVGIREIFIRNLLCGAFSFVLVHNHPSGDPSPSALDMDVTRKVNEAADIMGLSFLDHLIIGAPNNFYSFKEHEII